jgi:hypothetical protein
VVNLVEQTHNRFDFRVDELATGHVRLAGREGYGNHFAARRASAIGPVALDGSPVRNIRGARCEIGPILAGRVDEINEGESLWFPRTSAACGFPLVLSASSNPAPDILALAASW